MIDATDRPMTTTPFLTATFYSFVSLPDAAALCARLRRECEARRVTGTVVIAAEGLNGTIAGPADGVHAVIDWLRADTRLAKLRCLTAPCDRLPLRRLKVHLKPEIVKLGIDGIDPATRSGVAVAPGHWNRLLARDDLVLIDVRNDYEVALGSFVGAVDPRTARFSDLPRWIECQRAEGGVLAGRPAIATFCTGGIRCEKATALLRAQGFDEVYQLSGGILAYLRAVAAQESRWRGECFVFDERVSVGHGLHTGSGTLCGGCGRPILPREPDLPWSNRQEGCCDNCAAAAAASPDPSARVV